MKTTPIEARDPATTIYRLDNGLRVLIREDHFAPVAALQVWVGAGAADERAIEAGVAHVHEHMLFKGTANRGLGEIASAVESAGGRINAWTSWNETVYHIVLASAYADQGIDVLADAVRNSSFDADELDKELEVVLEEWKRGEDSPSRRVFNSLFATAFREHPYRNPVIGTEESIKGLTREKVLDFFGRFYTPNNVTVIVVGDVDTAHVKQVVADKFGDWQAREIQRPERKLEPQQQGLRFDTISMDVRETQLALAFHVPSARHADAPLLDLLAFVMGGGETSRLYRRLVITEQLANSAGTFAYTPPDPGLLVTTISLEAEDLDRAYATTIEELAALRKAPISQEELERARINLESDFVFRYETVQGQAREVGYLLTVHDDPNYDHEYLRAIREATVEDLQRVALRYINRDNLTVVSLLPSDAANRLSAEDAAAGAAPLATEVEMAAAPAEAHDSHDSSADQAAAVRRSETTAPRLFKLDNGIRLIIAEHHDVPVFAVRAVMLGGVLAETAATNGISNFAAEMLTRGTTKRSRKQLAEDIESIAGSLNGFSGHNSLGVAGSFLSDHFAEATELFLETLQQPAFAREEVEQARRELLLAIKNREDDTAHIAFDLAFATVYPDHPYGMTTLGETASVSKISAQDLRRFYARALNPEALVVTVVGDVDLKSVVSELGGALGGIAKVDDPFVLPAPAPAPEGVRSNTRSSERHQAHLVVGFPSVTVRDPDRYALSVLDNILSGQSGRLFYELRDRQSLAYSVTSFFTKGLAKGLFGAYIGTDPSNTEVAMKGLLAELQKVRSSDVSAEELERAARYLIGSRAISLQTNGAMSEDMAFNELYGLGYLAGREYADKIKAVSLADVRRVAEKYLDPDIRAEIIVGPPEALKAAGKN